MADKITVTSRNSYGSRIKNSFGKIVWWIVFVILSIVLIFKNEQNFLQMKVALNEGAEIVKEAISTEINPNLDQAEVHLYWETNSPAEVLKDPVFGVITDDLKMQRNVEMYQWVERSEEKCTDNIWWSETCETTYYYEKMWTPYKENSSNFYESAWHENPSMWKYEAEERNKNPILLGVYTLDDAFVSDLVDYKLLNLSEQDIIVPEEYKIIENVEIGENFVEENNNSYLYWENGWEISNSKFHVTSNYIYIWNNELEPQIWDLKITFSSVRTWVISVIWQQVWNSLTSYTASNWKTIALLEEWQKSADVMFINAQNANKTWTWIFRGLLLFLMFIWFSMMFEFITTLAKVLPFLSRIIGVWTSMIAFALTLIFGFLAIWISRLAVRPIVWLSCLIVVVLWIVLLVRARKNKKSNSVGKSDDKDVEIIEA